MGAFLGKAFSKTVNILNGDILKAGRKPGCIEKSHFLKKEKYHMISLICGI